MVVSQNQQLVDAREIINELMVAQQGFQECLDKAKLRDDQIQADQRHFDRTAREDRAKLKEALVTMERAAMIVSGEAEWITLPAWCRVMGMKWTEAWLEKAEKVLDRTCKARKIEWKSIPHETLGRVHSYPTELLEEWWKAIPRSEWNEAVEVEADGEDE